MPDFSGPSSATGWVRLSGAAPASAVPEPQPLSSPLPPAAAIPAAPATNVRRFTSLRISPPATVCEISDRIYDRTAPQDGRDRICPKEVSGSRRQLSFGKKLAPDLVRVVA